MWKLFDTAKECTCTSNWYTRLCLLNGSIYYKERDSTVQVHVHVHVLTSSLPADAIPFMSAFILFSSSSLCLSLLSPSASPPPRAPATAFLLSSSD